jgi:hypothetical protein
MTRGVTMSNGDDDDDACRLAGKTTIAQSAATNEAHPTPSRIVWLPPPLPERDRCFIENVLSMADFGNEA